MGCRRRSKSYEALAQAEAARATALVAHRAGDAEAAIAGYTEAERLLQIVIDEGSSLSGDAERLILACRIDKSAASSPVGASEALFEYLPKPTDADWELFVDFPEANRHLSRKPRTPYGV